MFWAKVYTDTNEHPEDCLLSTGALSNLWFGTSAPGGFEQAGFNISDSSSIINIGRLYRDMLKKHLVILDFFGTRVFEGQIVNTSTDGREVTVDAVGYYSTGNFVTAGPAIFSGLSTGAVLEYTITTDGTGYTVNDVLAISGGDGTARITVEEVSETGDIVSSYISVFGSGYAVGTGISLTGGTGSGAVISITVVESGSTAYDIVRFYVDLNPYWKDDFSRLVSTDLIPVGPFEFTRSTKVNQALQEVLKFGYLDTENYAGQSKRRPLYFYVWEHQTAELAAEPDPAIVYPDWQISIHDLTERGAGIRLDLSANEIKNKIYVQHNDKYVGGTSTTAAFEDTNSQELYGVIEGVLSIGNATADTAELVGDLAIKYNAFPKQRPSLTIIGTPRTSTGARWPLWYVRAGHLLKIMDVDPSILDISGSASSVGFIAKTRYDVEQNRLTVELGSRSDIFDMLLLRLGVSPGGIS